MSDTLGGFLSSSRITRFIFLYLISPFIKIRIPIGMKTHPIISITIWPKNLIKVTPTTKKVNAVLIYARNVLSFARSVRCAAK